MGNDDTSITRTPRYPNEDRHSTRKHRDIRIRSNIREDIRSNNGGHGSREGEHGGGHDDRGEPDDEHGARGGHEDRHAHDVRHDRRERRRGDVLPQAATQYRKAWPWWLPLRRLLQKAEPPSS